MSDEQPSRKPGQPKVRFETSDLKSSYCNVANTSSTREEVVLNFGINDSWDRQRDEIVVRLQHRVVMSPPAARQLRDLLDSMLEVHERKYGAGSTGSNPATDETDS